MHKPAIFFDRDGIIVKSINNNAPQSVEDLQLIPEIIPVIKNAKRKGYLVFVVSNQPDIALGLIDEKTKNEMELKFVNLLKSEAIEMDAIYYCRHDKNGTNPDYSIDCDCRKPKPGLLFQAREEFEIDMGKSFMIGDRASDVVAGKSAEVKTILYDPGNLQGDYLKEHNFKPDYMVKNLAEILQII